MRLPCGGVRAPRPTEGYTVLIAFTGAGVGTLKKHAGGMFFVPIAAAVPPQHPAIIHRTTNGPLVQRGLSAVRLTGGLSVTGQSLRHGFAVPPPFAQGRLKKSTLAGSCP